jgi:ferredoxin
MNLVSLTIDGRAVQVEPGQTVLQAARQLGLEIPTLCFLEQCTPATSCLVCLVKWKVNGQARMVPSCATKVQPGMVIESETEEVHEARRTALELLLSDHVGDCLSPCHRICPLHLNIPVMIRQIEAGRLDQAIVTVKQALPLPAILGRLCHHPCENGCRRGTWDEAAAIRDMERVVADEDLHSREPYLPPKKPRSKKSVVVVGSGPTGLSAAYYLLQQGHACTVVDRQGKAGGTLLSQVDETTLPRAVLDQELAQLRRLGLQLKMGVHLGTIVTLEGLLRGFDAVLLALGEISAQDAAALGVATTASGIKVDAQTYQTSVPGVFAAGSALKVVKQLVRAMSEGQAAAECIDMALAGKPIRRRDKVFSSMMGRLEKPEVELFLKHASSLPRQDLACTACASAPLEQASAEASRCLHCDCRSVGNCKLQAYAEAYGADANRFREQRRTFEQALQHSDILFEPGKCILCGICVQLAEQAREPLGLTFIGRGFEMRVAAPFNRTIAEGLQKVAAACVEHCPTGALVFREKPPAPLPSGFALAVGSAYDKRQNL